MESIDLPRPKFRTRMKNQLYNRGKNGIELRRSIGNPIYSICAVCGWMHVFGVYTKDPEKIKAKLKWEKHPRGGGELGFENSFWTRQIQAQKKQI